MKFYDPTPPKIFQRPLPPRPPPPRFLAGLMYVQRPALELKKVAVGQRGLLVTVYSYKINFGKIGAQARHCRQVVVIQEWL
jgi:hypothetical protein